MEYSKALAFLKPVYVTRPLLPDFTNLCKKLEEVWISGQLTNNGPQLGIFEKRLSNVLKVTHLSLFSNGTNALMVACRALGLSGQVITTPFTFPATPHVLTWNNIEPIFCDIDPVTMTIDADRIEPLITPSTTGILPVHIFGIPCNIDKIQAVADRHGLKILYDAAHAFGVEVGGQSIGNYGDISMISFHATKVFHTVEGGILTCKNEKQKEVVDLLRNFGIRSEDEVVMPGINSKMNEIQSVIGLLVLDQLKEEIKKRKELTNVYRKRLREIEGIVFQDDILGVTHNYSTFVIRIDQDQFGKSRDNVYDRFKEYNVYPRRYYSQLCSEYPHYSGLPSARSSNLPIATHISKQVLTLPLYGELTVDDVERICDILIEIKG